MPIRSIIQTTRHYNKPWCEDTVAMRQRARSLLLCTAALLWTTGPGAVARDGDGAGLIQRHR